MYFQCFDRCCQIQQFRPIELFRTLAILTVSLEGKSAMGTRRQDGLLYGNGDTCYIKYRITEMKDGEHH